ncbi:MAG: HAMP domain-containing sensor histidine kinase, partial [Methylococcaceae bacterium]|nr:HAMP domain-containing sensor histidine kinase [Methylococcaceae bacterium]
FRSLFTSLEGMLDRYETKLESIYSRYETGSKGNPIYAQGDFVQSSQRFPHPDYPGLLRVDLVKHEEAGAHAAPSCGQTWGEWLAPSDADAMAPSLLIWHVPLCPEGLTTEATTREIAEARFDIKQLFDHVFGQIRLGKIKARVYLDGIETTERFHRFEPKPVYASVADGNTGRGEFSSEKELPFAGMVARVLLTEQPSIWTTHGPGIAGAGSVYLLILSLVRTLRNHHERLRQDHERTLASYERGEAVAFIVHELATPMQGIIGCLEASLLCRESGQPAVEILQRDLKQAHVNALRACDFLDEIRGQIGRGKSAQSLRTVEIADLLHRVAGMAGFDSRFQGLALAVSAIDPGLRVHANHIALEMVLLNLLRNSAEAIRDAGQGSSINLEAWLAEAWVMMRVADDGPGLSRPDELFLPLKSTKAYGTGLGLIYCKRRVELLGGSITGGNRPEGGASFEIRLPRVAV